MSPRRLLLAALGIASCATTPSPPPSPPTLTVLLPDPVPNSLAEGDLGQALLLRARAKGHGTADDAFRPFFGAWVDRVDGQGRRRFAGLAEIEDDRLTLPPVTEGHYRLELFSGWEWTQGRITHCWRKPLPIEQQRHEGFVWRDDWTGYTHDIERDCHVSPDGRVEPATLDFRVASDSSVRHLASE